MGRLKVVKVDHLKEAEALLIEANNEILAEASERKRDGKPYELLDQMSQAIRRMILEIRKTRGV